VSRKSDTAMTAITLEQAIQGLINRTQSAPVSLPVRDSLRTNLLRCEFDIALSALYLVQFALGQTDAGQWDSDLPPRISLFQRALTALWQYEDPPPGVTQSEIFTRSMHDHQPAHPALRQLCTHHIEDLRHHLQQLARRAGDDGNGSAASPRQPLPHQRLPSRWELITAFAALHTIQAIVFQENQADILRRIEQFDQALECWWQRQG
jgi:hypothetical protein